MEEILGNAIDDNGNGLIDENLTHVPFGDQAGVTHSDKIDNDEDGEENSPVITQEMINAVSPQWNIWPSLDDPMQDSIIHIIGLDETDIGLSYADGIDNNADPEDPYFLALSGILQPITTRCIRQFHCLVHILLSFDNDIT